MNLEHPRPFVPNREPEFKARWACEEPENDDLFHVLWHAHCKECMVALQAALANDKLTTQTDLILMAHGATFKITDQETRQQRLWEELNS